MFFFFRCTFCSTQQRFLGVLLRVRVCFWFCLCVVFMVFFTFAVVFVVVVFDGNRDRLVFLLVFLFMLSRWYVSA